MGYFESDCEKWTGKTVRAHIGYGWGWSVIDKAQVHHRDAYEEATDAGDFTIRIARFMRSSDKVAVLIDQVEQPGHLFQGFNVICQPHGSPEGTDGPNKLFGTACDAEIGRGEITKKGHLFMREDDGQVSTSYGVPIYLGCLSLEETK